MYAPNVYGDENRKPSKPSVLKSIIPSSKGHKRSQSRVDQLSGQTATDYPSAKSTSILPPDHPHASRPPPKRPLSYHAAPQFQPSVLGERHHNRDDSSGEHSKVPIMSEDGKRPRALHKKTKSSVSLRSLVKGDKEKKADKEKDKESRSTTSEDGREAEKKIKKSKSSTSLSALLSKPRSSRGRKREAEKESKDKENLTPPSSSSAPKSPIWAEFATQPLKDAAGAVHYPGPASGRTIGEEMALYTPRDYSPSKGRNFHGYDQPTLSKRPISRARPKSEYLTSSTSGSTFTEQMGDWRKQGPVLNAAKGDRTRPSSSEQRQDPVKEKRTSRVMATVAAFDSKAQAPAKEPPMNPKEMESAFEALLDARNIPQNMRDKMRSLDTHIKMDFIRKDKFDGSTPGAEQSYSTSRPGTPGRAHSSPKKELPATPGMEDEPNTESKRPRPRSRTFTWSKGDKRDGSPEKKLKNESTPGYSRPKSIDISNQGTSRSLTSSMSVGSLSFMKKPVGIAAPDDFVSYLRKVQRPEIVEVGKLHKLRLLLRNETVAWVDSFISKGGMDEVVGLLNRIIEVEWREEHEDALLHETLLCLKALCTTSLALSCLATIQPTLFPTLLDLLFSEEHKGPSEFTTRAIIFSLLLTFLSSGGLSSDLSTRAETLLSYLRDPTLPEDGKPLTFIAEIYTSRPYKVWCKELVNVTKEVFWIFLHHLNVIPVTSPSPLALSPTQPQQLPYTATHFPRSRPPVAAAPYVGGVEWDATNYLASHIDLLNGIIASLPTRPQRNQLRTELRDSGFEKCMGGSLRTCKEKFYGAVHESLKTWVAAARDDGWDDRVVREGPPREAVSPAKKGGNKGTKEEPPKLDLALDGVGVGGGKIEGREIVVDEGWL